MYIICVMQALAAERRARGLMDARGNMTSYFHRISVLFRTSYSRKAGSLVSKCDDTDDGLQLTDGHGLAPAAATYSESAVLQTPLQQKSGICSSYVFDCQK